MITDGPVVSRKQERGQRRIAGRTTQSASIDHIGDEVAVAEHHSLAQPGCAAGVRDRGDVGQRVQRHAWRCARIAGSSEGRSSRGLAEHQHLAVTGLRGGLAGGSRTAASSAAASRGNR